MEQLIETFEALKIQFYEVSDLMDEIPEGEYDKKYVEVREELLELLKGAKPQLRTDIFLNFERQVIDFLCKNMGCHLDLSVLEKHCPTVLSEEQVRFIQNNSALVRWL